MLQVSQINKKYRLDPILSNINFTINATDHYGLVGINGTGKTTLLRIIAGNESADSGRTRYFPQDLRLGYLPQGMIIEDDNTILSYLCNGMDTLDSLEQRLMNLSDSLAQNPDNKKHQDEFDSTLNQINLLIEFFPRIYSDYLEQKISKQEKQQQAYQDQQFEIARLRRASAEMRSKAKYRKGGKTDPSKTDGFSIGFFANRTKETIQKAKNIEKRVEKLINEGVDKPARTWQMRVDFDEIPHSGRDVLILEDVQVGYENLVLIEQANFILNFGERVALIGENGSGKTSLIKTILGETPALAGTYRLGSQVKIGYMSQEQNQFDPDKSVLDSIGKFMSQNETENRSFLSKFLFKGDDVFKTIGSLSYGERARLSLACLVAEGCNFLILDEPINHLDIPSRTQFEKALSEFIGTILAVVHDRYFIDGYASQIWEIKEKRLLVRERMLPQTFG